VDNTRDEFIELRNLTDAPVPLYDTNRPAHVWTLQEAVEFSFPSNAVLAANAFALVVSFDPVADLTSLAAFRARYGLSANVALFGPYKGRLSNDGERLELRRPGPPNPTTGAAPLILVDRVDYEPLPPWSAGGGTGASLQRRNLAGFGNDPGNWVAAGPTPSAERTPGEPPTIVTAPQPRTAVEEESVSFSVVVSGDGPFSYQWYWNGIPLEGAYSPTLWLSNLLVAQSGDYSVYVMGGGGSVMSSPARLTVLRVPIITQQPVGTNVNPGSTVTFRVAASGTGPLSFQWQRNGADLPGATSDTLELTDVQLPDGGYYRVRVSDSVGTRTSQEVLLFVLVRPTLVQQPAPVNQTVAVGEDVTIRVEATGAQPLGYRWRKNGITYVSNGVETLTVTNVDLSHAGHYEVVVTNIAGGTTPALSARAYVVVVSPPASQAVAPEATVTLRAIVSSPGYMTNRFWWLHNGATLVGEGTNARTLSSAAMFTNDLLLANVTAAQAGQYTFFLSNAVFQTNLVSTNLYAVTTAFTATLVVGDTEPPAIVCPSNLSVSTAPGLCTAHPAFQPVATDNVGVTGTACAPPGPYPLGATTVTCWAWDLAGNSNSCAFTLTVADAQPPTLTNCPAPLTLSAGTNGLALVPDLRGGVSASDNCGPPTLTQTPSPGSQVGAGTNTVTLTAQDSAGNIATCQTALIVEVPVTEILLTVELQTTNAVIRWPDTPPTNWTLEEATNLTSPVNWGPSALVPVRQNGHWRAVVPWTDGTNKFFRLTRP
jgi:hypothetical protein